MTYVSAVQISVVVGVGLLIGFTLFKITNGNEPNSLTKSKYLADGSEYIDHQNHTPVCDNCGNLMREAGGKATMDNTETIPVYMRQSYECLNCDSNGVVETDINGIRVSGVVFRHPQTVETDPEICLPEKEVC